MKTVKNFYPNIEYNRKHRRKYFIMFILLVFIFLLMDAWFISAKFYVGLIINAFLILFAILTPKALKENPVSKNPVLTIKEDEVVCMGKRISVSDISWVKGIVYLGSVGNSVENRQFLEKVATEKPLEEMIGSIEIMYKENGKSQSGFAVIENVAEALLAFVEEGKVEYRLGYSLGKEYRNSTYNLKEFVAQKQTEKKVAEKISDKKQMKHLI